jgi:formate hydrogenlyase subunit 3/multisubunit Na+/H+ antiporter MnhD subunit
MSVALLKALVAFVPASMLLCGSLVKFFREKNAYSLLQLLGAGCMVVVVLTHVFEALSLLPGMQWGREHGVGHYLDFFSALLGLTLFPAGYLLQALTERHT